jgi:phosphatidylglycerophosphate synthase
MCHEVVICIVLAREFAVSGIRLIAAANPKGSKVIAAGMMGKMKTVLQMVASMLGLLAMALMPLGVIADSTYMLMANITNILMWVMAVLTVVSGMQYIVPNFDLIKNAK